MSRLRRVHVAFLRGCARPQVLIAGQIVLFIFLNSDPHLNFNAALSPLLAHLQLKNLAAPNFSYSPKTIWLPGQVMRLAVMSSRLACYVARRALHYSLTVLFCSLNISELNLRSSPVLISSVRYLATK